VNGQAIASTSDTAKFICSSTNKSDFDDYNDKRHDQKVLEEYFDKKYIIKLIDIVWRRKPPYRLLNLGAANGLTLAALAKEGIDAWGIENNAKSICVIF
jgi:hypothetical protein